MKVLNDIVLWLFRQLFQKLPLGFHYFWGRCFSALCRIFGYRRDVVVQNLSRSFPELKYGQIAGLKDKFYDHLGQVFAEIVWLGGCLGNHGRFAAAGMIRAEGEECLQDVCSPGPGTVVLASHLGNWELMVAAFDALDPALCPDMDSDKLFVVYKHVSNGLMDSFFLKNRRAAQKKEWRGTLESKSVLRHALSNRGKGHVYVFPNDQHPYHKTARKELPEPFMNQVTTTMFGGVSLASKLGMKVVYMSVRRLSRGHYTAVFKPICEDASKVDDLSLLQKYYNYLQDDIRESPADYLWSHRRWK